MKKKLKMSLTHKCNTVISGKYFNYFKGGRKRVFAGLPGKKLRSSAKQRKYKVIYADCPWLYSKSNIPKYGGVTYPTMTVEELKSLPITEIADKDCALFFWATFPKLQEALIVIKAWGFDYRTNAFTWIKQNQKSKTFYSGLGHWTNSNAEICLFAKKGHPKRIAKNIKQLVFAPLGRHSAKPNEARDRIVQLMGDVPRIELFAREKVEGWDAIGNEIDNKDIRDALADIISGQSTVKGVKRNAA